MQKYLHDKNCLISVKPYLIEQKAKIKG
jgi:hypothetical protein